MVGLRLHLRLGSDRLKARQSRRCSGRSLIRLADAVFIVTKRGDHSALSIEKQEIRIAVEEFCDERNRSVPTGEVKANDPIGGHVVKGIDTGALDASPEQLTEGGRGRRIGKMLMNEMDARRVVPQGAEQAAGMSGDTNLKDQSVGERLRNFLDPAFREGRCQFLDNGTNFCRS